MTRLIFPYVEQEHPVLGVLSSNLLANAFVHRVKAKINDTIFEMPIAVSTLSNIPPIFGRQEALDQFMVSFVHGKELILEINDI